MFAGNSLHVAVLSDQAKGDKRRVEEMKRSEVLKAGHFFTIADFLDRPEADIEDVFEPELYASILNSTYSLADATLVNAERLLMRPARRALEVTDARRSAEIVTRVDSRAGDVRKRTPVSARIR